MIPMLVLYIASLGHITFYSILGSFKLRKYEKDYEVMKDTLVDAYLSKENRDHVFRTRRYKLLGSLIDNSILHPDKIDTPNVDDDKIREALLLIDDIKNSKVVDLKRFELSKDNELTIQNERNRYLEGEINAEEFLSHPDKYNEELLKEIYIDFVKVSPLYAIEKYKEFMTKEALFTLLKRVDRDSEHTIEITNSSLLNLFEMLELDSDDYLKISIALSAGMIPEYRIKLFETISDTKDEAMDSYLFTLFDLEMLSPANAILDISQPDEYLNFKAYRALKENNQNFSINLFI
jgi:hypothetical protein